MEKKVCKRSSYSCIRAVLLAFLVSGLTATAGCATAPLSISGVNSQLTPQQVAQGAEAGGVVQTPLQVSWGGVIIHSTNLADATEIEVLAYPLDRIQRPVVDAVPVGRFLLRHPGYLETLDYAPGRVLTAVGAVSGIETGRVSQTDYRFAVLEPTAMHLWRRGVRGAAPEVSFGIGISLSN